jgi:hypothetical protein
MRQKFYKDLSKEMGNSNAKHITHVYERTSGGLIENKLPIPVPRTATLGELREHIKPIVAPGNLKLFINGFNMEHNEALAIKNALNNTYANIEYEVEPTTRNQMTQLGLLGPAIKEYLKKNNPFVTGVYVNFERFHDNEDKNKQDTCTELSNVEWPITGILYEVYVTPCVETQSGRKVQREDYKDIFKYPKRINLAEVSDACDARMDIGSVRLEYYTD